MNAVFGQFLDIYASFFYFLRYLVSAEALLVAALSGLCTALFSARWRQANVVANINLTFLVRTARQERVRAGNEAESKLVCSSRLLAACGCGVLELVSVFAVLRLLHARRADRSAAGCFLGCSVSESAAARRIAA